MSDFDPYRDWLGLETSSKPTYYQLIGVSPSEDDPGIIRRHALSQLRKLSQVNDPGRKGLLEQLNQRIKRAAKCLLNEERRREYDRKLREGVQESALGGNITDSEFKVAIDRKAKRSSSLSRQYISQTKRNSTLAFCMALGLLSCLGLSFLVMTQTNMGQRLIGASQPTPEALAKPAFDAGVEALPMEESEEFLNRSPKKVEGTSNKDASSPQEDSPNRAAPVPRQIQPSATSEAEPTPEERKELQEAFLAARQALADRDPQLAFRRLDQVNDTPKRLGDRAKFERLQLLTEYVDQYWQATEDALAKLEGGAEIVVSGQRIIVVENGDQEIVVRKGGRNETWQKDNLPVAMEVALAESWFNKAAPSTKVFRGAMMAVTPGFDPEEARSLWQQAAQQGEVIHDLEQVLDDKYD